MAARLARDEAFPVPGRILLSQGNIQARVRKLGRLLTVHYRGERPALIGVMNGALFFLADLLRVIDFEAEVSCVRLASYEGRKSTGKLRGLDFPAGAFRGRRELIVDDILDTGFTLSRLVARLRKLGAVEIKICVLLEKQRARRVPIHADWAGFRIADEFVVGYGLDYAGRFRGLKDIRVLAG